jgi:sigma-B regulation protein RsbU (phosphoserine phosphatase)
MQRLLDDFATLFDLDRRVRGIRLGDLVERAIDDLEQRSAPNWGTPGATHLYESERGKPFDFYYAPHLFPEMELSLRLAHKLQFYMLPREVPPDAPISIAAVLESYCHLSGDLFGWEMLADGRFLIWIVDLAGHGVQAGLSSAVLKVLIDNLRQRGRVGSLATELNDTFIDCLREDRGNLFATGFFMAMSGDGTACYTSTGHPPVLLRRGDGRIDELSSNGLPIGMFPDRRYTASETRLEPGDTMLLYTDGLVETTNEDGESFGIERLRGFLRSEAETPRSLTDSLYRNIAEHQDMEKLDDDVTFVAARVNSV